MRTGKLSISRGSEWQENAHPVPRLVAVPSPAPAPEPEPEPEPVTPMEVRVCEPAPQSADYHLVHDRLTALERLIRLHEQGALSPEEFAAEKTIILRLPAEELVLREAPLPPVPLRPRGPSLVGRMMDWKFLSLACAAGLAFSFATESKETMNFFDDAIGMFRI